MPPPPEGGVGAGVYDRLVEQRYKVRGVNFAWKPKNPRAHANMRAQIWCAMKEWLKTASIKEDKRLLGDLTGVRVTFSSNGAILLESKKDMRSRGLPSPDIADAICVTFAFPVANRETYESKMARQSPQKTYGFDSRSVSAGWMSH